MESPDHNLFQQIGQLQGTITAQSVATQASFLAVNQSINDFKIEFRVATSDQNKKIEDLRKEVQSEIKVLSEKVDALDTFKANHEGQEQVIQKQAKISGGITGGGVGVVLVGLIEIIKYLISK
jgi:hypothetical protein